MKPYDYALYSLTVRSGAKAREEHEVGGGIICSQRDGTGQDQRANFHCRAVRVAERG